MVYARQELELILSYSLYIYSWVWTEGGQNPDLELNLDVGGFGYPV